MMQGTKQELLDESEIFSAGWQFMKKYANPHTDEDWTELVQAAKDFPKPFKNQQFARDMVISIISQIEKRNKEKKKEQHDSVA